MCPECGTRPIHARSVCKACYERHRVAGTLDQLPTVDRREDGDYVAAEWEWLSSFGVSRDIAAAQLGMTRAAFDKALDRHAKRHLEHEAA